LSDASIVIGIILLGIVFLIVIAVYYSSRWSAEKELLKKRERVNAELTNVRFCISKYRREIERAKEILALGFIAMERGRVELKEEKVNSIAFPTYMMGYQRYNIYSLLEGALKTVITAEEDLLYSIERANARLADYNAYIEAPVFPRLVAIDRGFSKEVYGGFSKEVYDGGRLEELDKQLDKRIADINLLEGKIDKLLGETRIELKSLGEKADKKSVKEINQNAFV